MENDDFLLSQDVIDLAHQLMEKILIKKGLKVCRGTFSEYEPFPGLSTERIVAGIWPDKPEPELTEVCVTVRDKRLYAYAGQRSIMVPIRRMFNPLNSLESVLHSVKDFR